MFTLIISSIYAKSQLYTQFNFGYSVPIYNDRKFHNLDYYNYITTNDTSSVTETNLFLTDDDYLKINNGYFFFNETGYLIKNKFSISLNTYYFDNNLTKTSDKIRSTYYQIVDNNLIYSKTSRYNYNSSQIRISPQISLHFKIKELQYIFSLGYSFSSIKVYSSIDYKSTYGDSYKKELTLYDEKKIKQSILISNSFLCRLTEKISINSTITLSPLYFNVGKTIQNSIKGYKYDVNTNQYIYYEDNVEKEVSGDVLDSYHYFSIGVSVGIRYTFVKKNLNFTPTTPKDI